MVGRLVAQQQVGLLQERRHNATLGKAGAQVLLHYGRAASEADTVINQIKSDGGRAHTIAADLATAEGPEKLAFDVRRIVEDRLDVLVANTGISKLALIEDRRRGLMAATPPGFGSSSAASIPMGLRARHPAAGGVNLSGYV
jgi:NAD(P)-dependent dehydrogenase (short-subunit alcohol dehydrogenase family)